MKNYLRNEGVKVLHPWPGNNPYLNPLKNLLPILRAKVAAHKPTKLDYLFTISWEVLYRELTPCLCQKLVHRMPQRINEVLRNIGGPT